MKKNSLKNSLKNKKKETVQPFTVDCYNERLSSFNIFLMRKKKKLFISKI
jgi:hypothetical protein